MNLEPQELDELCELTWSYHEDSLSAEQAERLESLVLQDRRAREMFVQWSAMVSELASKFEGDATVDPVSMTDGQNNSSDAALRNLFARVAPESTVEMSSFRPSASSPLRKSLQAWNWQFPTTSAPAFLAALAIAFLLGGGMVAWRTQTFTDQLAAKHGIQDSYAAMAPAAYLMSANGCSWGEGMPKLQTVGSTIQIGGEVSLNEGIAEFRLANGVFLSLEGPAALLLASPSSIALQYGKVTSHVPWNVTDFKVIAGACRFTTGDADFGVIENGNKTDVHVFSGSVQVENPQVLQDADDLDYDVRGSLVIDDSGALTRGTVSAGNALSISRDAETLRVVDLGQKAKPECFATKLSMAGPLPVSKAYVDAVLASKPTGYWRFESTKDGVVPNEVAGGKNLKIVGNIRFVGQQDNYAIEFMPNQAGHLKSDPIGDFAGSDYSLELWVKPSHVHRCTFLSLFSLEPDKRRRSSDSLQLHAGTTRRLQNPPGIIEFIHQDFDPATTTVSRASCLSKHRYDVRRWQHVVAVKSGSRIQLYVDGVLSASRRNVSDLTSEIALLIGRGPTDNKLRLVGQMDEVAIYSRALSKEEIAHHYEIVEDSVHLSTEHKSTSNNRFHRRSRVESPFVLATASGDAHGVSVLDY